MDKAAREHELRRTVESYERRAKLDSLTIDQAINPADVGLSADELDHWRSAWAEFKHLRQERGRNPVPTR